MAKKRKLSVIFQFWLIITLLTCFVATMACLKHIQILIGKATSTEALTINLEDMDYAASESSDRILLTVTRRIASMADERGKIKDDFLKTLLPIYGTDEINVISPDGIITNTTNSRYKGFDMSSGEQSGEFLVLLDGKTKEFVQTAKPTTADDKTVMKYVGAVLKKGGFVQAGYTEKTHIRHILDTASEAAKTRHVGIWGSIIIADKDWNYISGPRLKKDTGTLYNTEDILSFLEEMKKNSQKQGEMFEANAGEIHIYAMYRQTGDFNIIAIIPQFESNINRYASGLVLIALQIILFIIIYILVNLLVSRLIVRNIDRTNESLAKITSGDLDETVRADSTMEFDRLSVGINSMVAALKQLINEADARIASELSFAKAVQHSSLPSVFPAFPDRKDFDIYATMETAKEVGGDFYDFFLLENDRLMFMIADVSGKGIPAAMFMMKAKALIKTYSENGLSPDEILDHANDELCQNNSEEIFVTAWLGIIDLKSGHLKYANAGHNPPLIRKNNGTFEYLKDKPNLVLAGMEGTKYRLHETDLDHGDGIFLYTDGITEAVNEKNDLFGETNLRQSLNDSEDKTTKGLCDTVRTTVRLFAGNAPQADDMTMVAFRRI